MHLTKSTVIALALSLLSTGALAKMSAEDVARLGKDLNPIGGIKAGTEDGLIPEWTGTVVGLPEGLQWDGPGKPYPDPWPDEKPLFTITKDNMEHVFRNTTCKVCNHHNKTNMQQVRPLAQSVYSYRAHTKLAFCNSGRYFCFSRTNPHTS